jgi:uncharacterized membrane protein YfcA
VQTTGTTDHGQLLSRLGAIIALFCRAFMKSSILTNGLVGLAVGVAGGVIGLGGAELRLPYLVGVRRLTAHQAVPVNLAVSLFTIGAAIPSRFAALSFANLQAFAAETVAIAVGAVIAAFLGVGWLRRLSPQALSKTIFVLLVLLGVGMITEAFIEIAPAGLLPLDTTVRLVAGLLFGFQIGAISSVLGVAGGEIIIPTLVFGYGVPVKSAGSLSMLISLPTVLTGIIRHARAGAFADRTLMTTLILPMGLGSAIGGAIGGLLVGLAPAAIIKVALGGLLVWSAWKIFAHKTRRAL